MRSHLKACVMYKRTQSKLDGSQQKLTFDIKGASSGSVGVMKIDSYDPKAIRVAIAKFIIMDELPFRIIVVCAAVLDPQYKVIYLDFWFKKTLGAELGAKTTSLVRGTLDQLFTEYSNMDGSSNSGSGSASQGQLEVIGSSSAPVDDPLHMEFTQFKAQQNLLDSKKYRSSLMGSRFITNKYIEQFKTQPNILVDSLTEEVKRQWKVDINESQV
ncbi:hypothetical protein CJ030_MR7G005497 [Morella rubra]|uniref:hAT-like transposase RNase-H fold domain-containing protein n=1 Tax=Morella rubra TaxID=262757 RepID=A0A6A1V4J9_9ROSI|nr:hypothetical protein CJ030_MR7G005497 [Morella rubra]